VSSKTLDKKGGFLIYKTGVKFIEFVRKTNNGNINPIILMLKG